MKNLNKQIPPEKNAEPSSSRVVLEGFFVDSLQEMYYAENSISIAFKEIKHKIVSPKLLEILKIHFGIHLKHKERLEKVFQLIDKPARNKVCEPMKALLSEGIGHLAIFADDSVNFEIALILVSQKLTYYKIASYGGLAHLAINLNYHSAAALLAFSVQEEEEFIENNFNGVIEAFLTSNVEGYKRELN